MKGGAQSLLSLGSTIMRRSAVFCRFSSSVSSAWIEEHAFQGAAVADSLKSEEKCADGSWLWGTAGGTIYGAVKSMAQQNVGALVAVKPVEQEPATETISESCSTICFTGEGGECEEVVSASLPKDSSDALKQWGCTDDDLAELFKRQPSLRNARLALLNAKLSTLSSLGITGSDLVKVINCRPRFLWCRINHHFDERISYFMSLFGSKEMLRKAIIRNPSFLTHDFHSQIKPAISLYEQLGLSREDLILMLLSRPTMISRTSFEPEKVDYIRRTGVPATSKMYKYVVTLIGISRLKTIQEKVANLERFGFTEEEVLRLIGRSPLLLTLSVDKVQRNMTFILGTMKASARSMIEHPHILYCNLETTLKPRMALAAKIKDMGLQPRIEGNMYTALRMSEKRFLKAYVRCHPEDVAEVLMELYNVTKGFKRLAETSRKRMHKGFPF